MPYLIAFSYIEILACGTIGQIVMFVHDSDRIEVIADSTGWIFLSYISENKHLQSSQTIHYQDRIWIIMQLSVILRDEFEFVGVNDENFISDWWHYGSWENNCVPTAQTGFTE